MSVPTRIEREHYQKLILVFDRKTKRVLSTPGGSQPIYTDGKLQPMHQTESVFKHCHDLYVDSAGDIYVGEWNADRRYPWKLSLVKCEAISLPSEAASAAS